MSALKNKFAPSVEALDQRAMMSCTVAASFGHLTVTGDSGNDQVTIRDNGRGGITVAATGAATQTFSGINHIDINTEDGDDNVTYTVYGNIATTQYVVVGLGSQYGRNGGGNDTFHGMIANGVDILNGGRLDMIADGGGGDDVVTFTAIGVDVQQGGILKSQLGGGAGQDQVQQYFNGLDNGAVVMRSHGGDDHDNIWQSMTFAAGSTGHTAGWVTGDDGDDSLSLFMNTSAGITIDQADLVGGNGVDGFMYTQNVNVIQ
ncbi:MAG: hypothetical protein K8U57_18160 [Planctomycetes bacterium]|nr:hypothetical protein [Planctomycetota bacterium]